MLKTRLWGVTISMAYILLSFSFTIIGSKISKMKKIKRYLVATVVFIIVVFLVTYLHWIEPKEVNTTLSGLLGAGVFWRTLEFFHIKEAGVPTGLAIAQAIVIFPIDGVREQVKKTRQDKKKKEADEFTKQLFSTKRK